MGDVESLRRPRSLALHLKPSNLVHAKARTCLSMLPISLKSHSSTEAWTPWQAEIARNIYIYIYIYIYVYIYIYMCPSEQLRITSPKERLGLAPSRNSSPEPTNLGGSDRLQRKLHKHFILRTHCSWPFLTRHSPSLEVLRVRGSGLREWSCDPTPEPLNSRTCEQWRSPATPLQHQA